MFRFSRGTVRVVVLLGVLSAWGPAAIGAPQAIDATPPIDIEAVERLSVAPVDLAAAAAEDRIREERGEPVRFAVPRAVDVTPESHGSWETLPDGAAVWRLRVHAESARSLNLGFVPFEMPAGGELVLRGTDGKARVRPFTAADNAAHGELWTPVVDDRELLIEVRLPADRTDELRLKLVSINVGYRDFGDLSTLSGSCNIDVVCPAGDDWLNEIPAVGAISLGGSVFCTGFMVNNTSQDRTPYFMTAAHCGVDAGDAASLVVYWNYETTPCGGSPNGSLSIFQTGAFWRSSYSPSDFTLVELDEDPDPEWGITYAGWDRSSDDATSAIAIHHPSGDEKRISFENDPTTTTSYLGDTVPGNGTHIRVIDWDLGTTEPGSSGSPLFNQDHRVIGQLHGGYASCSSQTSDWYGRFSVSWTGGGGASSRLSDWLDPTGTGAVTVDTLGIGPAVRYSSHAMVETAGNGDGILDPGESATFVVTARNAGSEDATAVSGTLTSPMSEIVVDDGQADWPDLVSQQSASSLAPHFAVTLAADAECGTIVPFDVVFNAAEMTAATSGFAVQVGQMDPGEIVEFADDMEQGANGWTTEELVASNPFAQTTNRSSSPVHSWFVNDISSVSDSVLISPWWSAVPPGTRLEFEHYVASEANYDGGVLEYTVDGTDWIDAGSRIVQGGYNATISTNYSSPIGGRPAWAGNAGGWGRVVVDLADLAGSDVRFRWRFATDSSVDSEGWYVDDVELVRNTFTCNPLQLGPPGEASSLASAEPFHIDPDGSGGFELTWSEPVSGAPPEEYVLYHWPIGSTGTPSCVGALGSGLAANLAALPDDSAFVVVARNAAGEGSYGTDDEGIERPVAVGGDVCP